ncbi:DUF3219 family protein [Peribacillus sp. SCS-26]|uniref:DUF3219 family protein n=1 Tax=Paraperibacillus marinus TaxID=3115295 RepID=UPI0039062647
METKVRLNEKEIQVYNYQQEEQDSGRLKITFEFTVTHEEYHDITTLLYKQEFDVSVPEQKLEFRGTICNYWTSFTNLYNAGASGEFHLELMQVKDG